MDYTAQSLTTTSANSFDVVTFLVLLSIFVIIFAATYAVMAWILGRIFKKAGVPQYIAWIPVYNSWKMLEIGGQHGFWAVLAFLPFINIVAVVFMYIAMYHIGRKLGKEEWFILIGIFLPIVWYIWLAFDDSTWTETPVVATSAPTPPAAA